MRLSLLKTPSVVSLLGFRICHVDTPYLTSGRKKRTRREIPASILRIILLLFRVLFWNRSQMVLENLAFRQQLPIVTLKPAA